MFVRRRMLKLVLKFLQAIVGEGKKELDAIVGGLGVTDFVRFQGGEIVFLLSLRGATVRRAERAGQSDSDNTVFDIHVGHLRFFDGLFRGRLFWRVFLRRSFSTLGR